MIEKDKIVDTIVSERFLSETLEQIGGGGSDIDDKGNILGL